MTDKIHENHAERMDTDATVLHHLAAVMGGCQKWLLLQDLMKGGRAYLVVLDEEDAKYFTHGEEGLSHDQVYLQRFDLRDISADSERPKEGDHGGS